MRVCPVHQLLSHLIVKRRSTNFSHAMLQTTAISGTKLQIKYPPISASQEFMNPFPIPVCITTTEIYLPQPIHLTVSKRSKILRQRIPPRDSLRDSPNFFGLEIVPLSRLPSNRRKRKARDKIKKNHVQQHSDRRLLHQDVAVDLAACVFVV